MSFTIENEKQNRRASNNVQITPKYKKISITSALLSTANQLLVGSVHIDSFLLYTHILYMRLWVCSSWTKVPSKFFF